MAEEFPLGKARLDLEVNLDEFVRNMRKGRSEGDEMQANLDALAAVSEIAEAALGRVKMSPRQAAESDASASSILEGVRGISDESRAAADHLDKVKLTESQATESVAAGERIKHNVKDIGDEADRSRRKIEELKLSGRNGAGVGPFGSGFGRVGLLGTAIGAGVLAAPAAGPGLLGLAGASVGLLGGLAGAAGTLALAFDGVSKAISGDKKAFDSLNPAAQQFVLTVRSLDGWFDKLKETAGKNLFPGLTEALHSALTPGTVNAISTAVAELAKALGDAGAAWGKYFGSTEFQSILGPLMKDGAKNIGVMSDTIMHLFDALGTFARAAMPFTDWLTKAIDDGAKFVDSWIHAKDATGQLSRAMNEAQQSLQLVGRLGESLLKVIVALGTALYPVSKIAVKDLTDGLNALAGMIQRNQGTIRQIVEGALAALISTVHVLTPIVTALAHALGWVVQAVGGWKTAFEIVLGGFLVMKFAALGTTVLGVVSDIAKLRVGILALGAPAVLAALAALGYTLYKTFQGTPTSAAGDLTPVKRNGLWVDPNTGKPLPAAGQAYWNAGGPNKFAPGASVPASMVPGTLDVSTHGRVDEGVDFSQKGAYGALGAGKITRIIPNWYKGQPLVIEKLSKPITIGGKTYTSVYYAEEPSLVKVGERVAKGQGIISGGSSELGFADASGALARGHYTEGQATPEGQAFLYWLTNGMEGSVGVGGGSSDVWGSQPPWTKNTGQLTAKQKAAAARRALAAKLQIPVTNDQTMVSHYKALAGAATAGPAIERYVDDEIKWLKKENADLEKSMHGKSALQKARIHAQIQKNEDEIPKLHSQVVQAIKMAADASAFTSFQAHMTTLTQKFKGDSAYASVLTGAAAEKYQSVLLGDLNSQRKALEDEKAKLTSELASATGKRKTQLKSELTKVKSSLSSVDDQVLQSLESTVQTLQGHTSTYLTSVISELDAAFEASTQTMVDQLGAKFFQNGLQTPLEAQLAKMQQEDQLASLKGAIASATDPAAKAAAQRQLQEYNLSIDAQAERSKADKDYAAAVQKLTAERTALESTMNAQLAKLSDGILNGTNSVGDLAAVAAEFGVKISKETIPDFDNLATSVIDLQAAFAKLSDYIDRLTGTSPTSAAGVSAGRPIGRSLTSVLGGSVIGKSFNSALAGPAIPGSVRAAPVAVGGLALAPSRTGDVVLQVDGREFARATVENLDGPLAGTAARKLNAHLDRESQATL